MGEQPQHRISGVVLFDDHGRVLLQHRDDKPTINAPGQWVFPGGHCLADESPEACARREFSEECGYVCGALKHFASINTQEDLTGKPVRVDFFWGVFDGHQTIRCFEGQEITFVSREAATGLPKPEYLLPIWDLAEQCWRK